MNRADVLRMAREARFPVNHPDWADAAVRFAALVAANANAARITAQLENEGLKARIVASGVAERRAVREAVLAAIEEAAKLCELSAPAIGNTNYGTACHECAEKIRNLK